MCHVYHKDPVKIESVTCRDFLNSYEFHRLIEKLSTLFSYSMRKRSLKEKTEYLLHKAAEFMGKLHAVEPLVRILLKEFDGRSCLPDDLREIITRAKTKEIAKKGWGERYLLRKLQNKKVRAKILAHMQVKIRISSDVVATWWSNLSGEKYSYTTITLPDDILKLVDKE